MVNHPVRVEEEQQFDWRIRSAARASGKAVSLPQNLPPLALRPAEKRQAAPAPQRPLMLRPSSPQPSNQQKAAPIPVSRRHPAVPPLPKRQVSPVPAPRPRRVRKVSPAAPLPRTRKPSQKLTWRWPIFWLSVLGGLSATGLLALLWLTNLPPLPDCKTIPPLASDADRLYCAREAAQTGTPEALVAGLQVIKPWTEAHPLHRETQPLLKSWSERLLAIARQKVEQADLQGAVALAWKIPRSSPVYPEAQKAIVEWRSQWHQGEAIVAQAQASLQAQNWKQASEQLLALGDLPNDYWRRQQLDELTRRIVIERTAAEGLQQAQKLAKGNRAEGLAQAIALVRQIDPSTYVWPQASLSLAQWSTTLADAALTRWRSADRQGAMALAQQIPPTAALPGEARDLVNFSYAAQLASASTAEGAPSWQQVWGLREAIAALQRIAPGSPFYTQAQTSLRDHAVQLQDLHQLQSARAIASLGQQPALELAIQQAQQVGADRPQSRRAQALIAAWGLDIQRLQDLPYLAHARTLAAPGTIPALQQAIAAAQQVPQNRALRADADAAIAEWTARIQTIEDQPLFDRARQLADQNQLREAIQEARKIQQGRALYAPAQAAIAAWRSTIQEAEIAQDRKIMDEANGLAARGRLSLAIEAAGRIGAERPLYSEARSAIALWRDQRDQIWSDWGVDDGSPSDAAPSDIPDDSAISPDAPDYSQ